MGNLIQYFFALLIFFGPQYLDLQILLSLKFLILYCNFDGMKLFNMIFECSVISKCSLAILARVSMAYNCMNL